LANPNDKTINRADLLYGLGLFLLTALSRIPFRSQILYHWDSVNFAFAMRRFDLAAEQPQPPGYIVYVWLCRLTDALFHDPQTTMVWIAVVSSGLAVVAMYLLGRATFDRQVGLVGALLLASSPLFWFYGEIALPHALDLLLVTLSVWLLYEAAQGQGPYLLAAAVSLAIAGGVRQQTPIFLGLLLLLVLVNFFRRTGWATGLRWTALSAAIGGLLCAAWFLPLINSTGGLGRYLEVMGAFSARFNATTSLFMGAGSFGLLRNLRKLGMYTLYGWGIALLPFGLWILIRLVKRDLRLDWSKILFLLAWLIPAFFFYTVIHMGQQGLVFVFLPALLLLSALGLSRLLPTVEGPSRLRKSRTTSKVWPRQRTLALSLGLILLNGLIFLAMPEYPLGNERLRLLTRATLVNSDRYYRDRFEAIAANFAPQSTAILADHWHHVEYYLPEYARLPFGLTAKWEKGEGMPSDELGQVVATPADLGLQLDNQGQAVIAIFDPYLMIFNKSASSPYQLPLKHGASLDYYTLTEELAFRYGGRSFGVEENP